MTEVDIPEPEPGLIGAIVAYANSTVPTGWLECNGQVIPAQYTELIAKIGSRTLTSVDNSSVAGTMALVWTLDVLWVPLKAIRTKPTLTQPPTLVTSTQSPIPSTVS